MASRAALSVAHDEVPWAAEAVDELVWEVTFLEETPRSLFGKRACLGVQRAEDLVRQTAEG